MSLSVCRSYSLRLELDGNEVASNGRLADDALDVLREAISEAHRTKAREVVLPTLAFDVLTAEMRKRDP